MPDIGNLSERVRFERQARVDDGYGNVLADWQEICTVWAWIRPQFGNEALQSGRLESTTVGTLAIHNSAVTRSINAGDRAVGVAGHFKGRIFNLRSCMPYIDGSFLEIKFEEGVAT